VTLLETDVLARLESLQLQTRTRLAGKFGGDHRSLRYGNTVDFADFREYNPGDDYRRIDYHVLARLDQLLIKLYEANDEIVLRLLIDTSASMNIGGKLEQAKKVAAGLGFVALTAHDTVSVHTFPQVGRPPRFTGRVAVPSFFTYLESLKAEGPTPFAAATAQLLSRSGPPGITAVISDILTPDWDAVAHLRARGSDLVVLHLLADEDTTPDLLGDIELIHPEGKERLPVSLTPDELAAYADRVEFWRQRIADRCHGVGAVYVPVGVEANIGELLMTTWRDAGVVR
jgi:uncharacterized protein (DUF58 family)